MTIKVHPVDATGQDTSWLPALSAEDGPLYRAIAEALARDVQTGRLAVGTRLPTHRDLAWRLGVTVGTVSRAYREAERRGLIGGEVGRGTYVRAIEAPPSGFSGKLAEWYMSDTPEPTPDAPIPLNFNFPPEAGEAEAFRATMADILAGPGLDALLRYAQHGGIESHRRAGAAWISERGLEADPQRVMVTTGAHNGILVSLAATTRAGDAVLVEALSYPGIKPVARMFGLKLVPVAMDGEGMHPDALEEAARTTDARAIYTVPTLQNPTNRTMSEARRRAIADVARRCDLAIIEDDLLGMLKLGAPPPIACFAPERAFYISSASKTLGPGLRIGFVQAPADQVGQVGAAIRASNWMAAPILAEVVARWIADGTAQALVAARRRELSRRHAIVRRVLSGHPIDMPDGALHAWLHLPADLPAGEFVAGALEDGVSLSPADAFCIGRTPVPQGIRVCVGPAHDAAQLEQGVMRLRQALERRVPLYAGAAVM